MSQTQSLKKKSAQDSGEKQSLQRSANKNSDDVLNKKESATSEETTALQKKIYRTAEPEQPETKMQRKPRLQTKLSVSEPGDSHEQEADRVADEVVSRSAAPVAEENKLSPGNTKPENNAASPQSLQTKISRMEEPAAESAPVETEASSTEAEAATDTATNSEQGVSAEVERQIAGLRGQGAQLPEQVRTEMESQFNHDFSSVSIHTGGTADALCKQLSARAFTVGSDIFFASGEYAPDSQEGKRLLAHELTHVVQQGSGVTRKIMRDVNTETNYEGAEGKASTSDSGRVEVNEIHFPNVPEKSNKTGSTDITIRKGNVARNTNQLTVWSQLTREGAGITASLDQKISTAWRSGSESNPVYFLKLGLSGTTYIVGTRTQIRDRVIRPYWTPTGEIKTYDVDHKKEFQLGGHDRDPDEGNLWLLESGTNRSCGSVINSRINTGIQTVLDKWTSSTKPTAEVARNTYTVVLKRILWDLPVGDTDNYQVDDIANRALQMGPVLPMTRNQVQAAGLDPGPGRFVVFNNSTGGRARVIDIPATPGESFPFTDETFITGFRPTTATIGSEDQNYIRITGVLWANNRALYGHGIPVQFSITKMENLPQAGYLNVTQAESQIREIFGQDVQATGLSPLQLTNVGFNDKGEPDITGKVITDVSFLRGASIDFFIRGNNLGIEKTFLGPELNTPAPFKIEQSSLTVSLSTQRGLAADGNVLFKIDRVGQGSISASVGTGESFSLAGDFAFDERIFGQGSNAKLRLGYSEGIWSMGGDITIPRGKVPGVETATITVDYSQATGFSARGNATLNVPGVESGTIEITQNEAEGFVIGGAFNLRQGNGIRSGSVNARVREKPDGTGYAVTAHGEAQPDIPGINSNLIVDYNDGAFTAEVSADYSRGMLSGRVNAGVTNRSVNPTDGTLSATAEPNNPLVVYGGGQLTLQIAPWLQGTAGVRFAPNGEVTVTGEIGLPSQLEIFARKEINKSIFNIAVQAPIFPGIVAEVGGGLSATAGIGPGVIDQLRLGITYNPAHEDQTRITGDAHLNIPANAGLRLSVRAGIGLGITGASATGGLDIGGTLGIEGAAEAGVHVEWTPATGLDIRTELAIHAQPSFTFDIGGYVSVRALGFEVYDNRWQFASYTFGSDYRFGIRLPIHYHEGEPFDISLDDVQFEVPNIDTDQLLRGLIARIA